MSAKHQKRRLILHVGHPKTGTTALQSVLAANPTRLLQAGVLYPTEAAPLSYNHQMAAPYLTGQVYTIPWRPKVGTKEIVRLSAQYWQSLTAEAKKKPYSTIILSAERLWTTPQALEPSFRERLSAICDQVTVVAYLRSPERRFLSETNQHVRMFRAIAPPQTEYYKDVLDAYSEEGFSPFELNVFAPESLVGGDIITDFCQKYLPPGTEALDRTSAERRNESVSNEALFILERTRLRYARRVDSALHKRRARLVNVLREADREVGSSKRPSLKPEIAKAVVAQSSDLNWLRVVHGVEFKDVDYDLVGTTGHADLKAMSRVEDFCPIDAERLAELCARTRKQISYIFDGGSFKERVRDFFGIG